MSEFCVVQNTSLLISLLKRIMRKQSAQNLLPKPSLNMLWKHNVHCVHRSNTVNVSNIWNIVWKMTGSKDIWQYPGNIRLPTSSLIWFVLNFQKLRNECLISFVTLVILLKCYVNLHSVGLLSFTENRILWFTKCRWWWDVIGIMSEIYGVSRKYYGYSTSRINDHVNKGWIKHWT